MVESQHWSPGRGAPRCGWLLLVAVLATLGAGRAVAADAPGDPLERFNRASERGGLVIRNQDRGYFRLDRLLGFGGARRWIGCHGFFAPHFLRIVFAPGQSHI